MVKKIEYTRLNLRISVVYIIILLAWGIGGAPKAVRADARTGPPKSPARHRRDTPETNLYTRADTAESIGAFLIHISTDYVFNGEGERPYTENDPVDPIGVYGTSKEAGESARHTYLDERCSRVYFMCQQAIEKELKALIEVKKSRLKYIIYWFYHNKQA